MNLQPILARLQATLASHRQIGGAVDLAAALEGRVTPPAAFLVPMSELGADPEFTDNSLQAVTARFAVIQAVSNKSDAVGAKALTDLEARRDDVKAALIGWTPDAQHELISFTSGQALAFQNGLLWWSDEFKTRFYHRS